MNKQICTAFYKQSIKIKSNSFLKCISYFCEKKLEN